MDLDRGGLSRSLEIESEEGGGEDESEREKREARQRSDGSPEFRQEFGGKEFGLVKQDIRTEVQQCYSSVFYTKSPNCERKTISRRKGYGKQ